MGEEKLSYDIQLRLDKLIAGYQELAKVMDHVKDAVEMQGAKKSVEQYLDIVSRTTKQIDRLLQSVKFQDITTSLTELNSTTKTISENMVAHLKKISAQEQQINKSSLKGLKTQLENLSAGIEKFGTIAKGSLAQAFKDEEMQKATASLRKYIKALDEISKLNMNKLTKNLTDADLSALTNQVKQFAQSFDKLNNINRRVESLKTALLGLNELFPLDKNDSLDKLKAAFEDIKNKATTMSNALNDNGLRQQGIFNKVEVRQYAAAMKQVSALVGDYVKKIGDAQRNRNQQVQTNFFVNMHNSIQKVIEEVDKLTKKLENVGATIARSVSYSLQIMNQNVNLAPVLNQFGLLDESTQNVLNSLRKIDFSKIKQQSTSVQQSGQKVVVGIEQQINTMVATAESGINKILDSMNRASSTNNMTRNVQSLTEAFKTIRTDGARAASILQRIGGVTITKEQVDNAKSFSRQMTAIADKIAKMVGSAAAINSLISDDSVTKAEEYGKKIKNINNLLKNGVTKVSNGVDKNVIVDSKSIDDITSKMSQLYNVIQTAGNALSRIFGGSGMAAIAGNTKFKSITSTLNSVTQAMEKLSGNKETGVDKISKSIDNISAKFTDINQPVANFKAQIESLQGIQTNTVGPIADAMKIISNSAVTAKTNIERMQQSIGLTWSTNGSIDKVNNALSQIQGNVDTSLLAIQKFRQGLGTVDLAGISRSMVSGRQALVNAKTAIQAKWDTSHLTTVNDMLVAISNGAYWSSANIDALKQSLSGLDTSSLTEVLSSLPKTGGKSGLNIVPAGDASGIKLSEQSIQALSQAIAQAAKQMEVFAKADETTASRLNAIAITANLFKNAMTDIAGKTGQAGYTIGDVFANIAKRVGDATQDVQTNLKANIQNPVNQITQVTSASLDKFIAKWKGLSGKSIQTANGFFTAFESAGGMKEFATNLQQLTTLNVSSLNGVITSLQTLFNDLKNNKTSSISQTLAEIVGGFQKMSTTIDSGSISQIKQSLQGLTTGLSENQFSQIIASFSDISAALGRFADQLSQLNGVLISNFKSYTDTVANSVGSMSANIEALRGQGQQLAQSMDGSFGAVTGGFVEMNRKLEENSGKKMTVGIDQEQINKAMESLAALQSTLEQIQKTMGRDVSVQGFGSSIGNIITRINQLSHAIDSIKKSMGNIFTVKLDKSQFNEIVRMFNGFADSVDENTRRTRQAIESITSDVVKFAKGAKEGFSPAQQQIGQVNARLEQMKSAISGLAGMKTMKLFDETSMGNMVALFNTAYLEMLAMKEEMEKKPKDEWSRAEIEAYAKLETMLTDYEAQINRINKMKQESADAEKKARSAEFNKSGYDKQAAAYAQVEKRIKDIIKALGKYNSEEKAVLNSGHIKDLDNEFKGLKGDIETIAKVMRSFGFSDEANKIIAEYNNHLKEEQDLMIDITALQEKAAADAAKASAAKQPTGKDWLTSDFGAAVESWKQARTIVGEYRQEVTRVNAETGEELEVTVTGVNDLGNSIKEVLRLVQSVGADGEETATIMSSSFTQTTDQVKKQKASVEEVVNAYKDLKQANEGIRQNSEGTQEYNHWVAVRESAQEVIDKYNALTDAQKEVQYGAEGMAKISKAANNDENTTVNKLIGLYGQLEKEYQKAAQLMRQGKTEQAKAATERADAIQKQIDGYQQTEGVMNRVKDAMNAAAEAKRNMESMKQQTALAAQYENLPTTLENVRAKYAELIQLRKEFDRAQASGNTGGMAYYAGRIQAVTAQLEGTKQLITNLPIEKKYRDQILALIERATAAEKQRQSVQKSSMTIGDKLLSQMMSMVKMYVGLQGIRRLWSTAKTYATEYYDKINEIQMVTGKTDAFAQTLVTKYQQMAKELSASSTEIAEAAVTFYRQGLDTSAVDDRLVATTKYAKIAGIEFTTAADIITASMNTLGKEAGYSTEQITDVFISLGNAAGSSAEEIGTAMQRASASAEAAGVSFEWLGSYIATISEATRQSAESIGTAMTSIMSRLHNIKAKGYNDDDEFGVNDVAKALAKLPQRVSLFDSITGQWRDMSDILQDVAAQWDQMNDRQRSYVATVMAGTRQQNYFLALMQDMSKGAEGGSRAFELYNQALNAAGTTANSYRIYTNSVTAAHDEMNAKIQETLSLIVNDKVLKNLYNTIGNLVEIIGSAIKGTDGWNLKWVAIAAGAAVAVSAFTKIKTAVTGLITTMHGATTLASGIMATAGGWITLLTTAAAVIYNVVSAIGAANKVARDREIKRMTLDYDQMTTTMQNSADGAKRYIDQYKKLGQSYKTMNPATDKAKETLVKMETVVTNLCKEYPAFGEAMQNAGMQASDFEGTLKTLNGQLDDQYEKIMKVKRAQAMEDLRTGRDTEGSAVYKYNEAVASKAQKALYNQDSSVRQSYDNLNLIPDWGSTTLLSDDFLQAVSETNSDKIQEYGQNIIKKIRKYRGAYSNTSRSGRQAWGIYQRWQKWFNSVGYDLKEIDINQLVEIAQRFNAYEDEMKNADDAIDIALDGVVDMVMATVDTENTTSEQMKFMRAKVKGLLKETYANNNSGMDIGVFAANYDWDDMINRWAKYAEDDAMSKLLQEYVEDYGFNVIASLQQKLMSSGINSDMLSAAKANMTKYGHDFVMSDYIIGDGQIQDEALAELITTWSNAATAARQAFVDGLTAPTEGLVPADDVVQNAIDKISYALSTYDDEEIAQAWTKLMSKGLSTMDVVTIANSENVLRAVETALQEKISDAVKTWDDTLAQFKSDATVSAKEQIDLADKILQALTLGGQNPLKDFIEAYNTLGKTEQGNISKIFGFDNEFWDSIIDGTANVNEMTQAFRLARETLNLGTQAAQDTYLDGLDKVFESATYSATRFSSAASGVLSKIAEVRQARYDIDQKQDYSAASKLFGDSDNKLYSTDRVSSMMTDMETSVTKTIEYIQSTIESLIGEIDWQDVGKLMTIAATNESQVVKNMMQLYLDIQNISASAEAAQTSLQTLFGTTLDGLKGGSLKDKNGFLNVLNGMISDQTIDEVAQLWTSKSEKLIDIFGQQFYDKMSERLSAGKGVIKSTSFVKPFIENQMKAMEMQMRKENFVGTLFVDSLGEAYANLLLDEGYSMTDTFNRINEQAESALKKYRYLQTLQSTASTAGEKDAASAELFSGKNFSKVQASEITQLTNDLDIARAQLTATINEMYTILGIEVGKTDDVKALAESGNANAQELMTLLGIQGKFTQTVNPFEALMNSMNADVYLSKADMMDYAQAMIDALDASGGADAFVEYWGMIGQAGRNAFIDKFGVNKQDYAELIDQDDVTAQQIVDMMHEVYAKAQAESDAYIKNMTDGMADIYNAARYSGSEFVNTVSTQRQNVEKIMAATKAMTRLSAENSYDNMDQDIAAVQAVLSGYTYGDDMTQYTAALNAQAERITGTYEWLRDTIQSLTTQQIVWMEDNDELYDQLLSLADSSDPLVANLAYLYSEMLRGQTAVGGFDDTMKRLASTSGDTSRQLSAAMSMMSEINNENWQDFKNLWYGDESFQSGASGLFGDEFTRYMNDAGRTATDASEAIRLMNQQIDILGAQKMEEYGTILSGTASTLEALYTNQAGADFANDMIEIMDTYEKQYAAYQNLMSGVGSKKDKDAWAGILGYQDYASIKPVLDSGALGIILNQTKQQIDETMNALAKYTSEEGKQLYTSVNGAYQALQKTYGNPLYTLFSSTIQNNVQNSADKQAVAQTIANSLATATIEEFSTMWTEYEDDLKSVFGEDFYRMIRDGVSEGNAMRMTSETASELFRQQAVAFGIAANEELTTPKAMAGLSEAYAKWIVNNQEDMSDAFRQLSDEAQSMVDNSKWVKILRDPLATLDQKDQASQALFGKDYLKMTSNELIIMEQTLEHGKTRLQTTINELYDIIGVQRGNTEGVGALAGTGNVWAMQLQDMLAIQGKFSLNANPFEMLNEAAAAQVDMNNTELADYLKRFTDAISSEGGTAQFIAFWKTLSASARKEFMDRFQLNANDFESMMSPAEAGLVAVDFANNLAAQFTAVIPKVTAEGAADIQKMMSGIGDAYAQARYGGKSFWDQTQSMSDEVKNLTAVQQALDRLNNYYNSKGEGSNRGVAYAAGYDMNADVETVQAMFSGFSNKAEDVANVMSIVNTETGKVNNTFAWMQDTLQSLTSQTIVWSNDNQTLIGTLRGLQSSSNPVVANMATLYESMLMAQEGAQGYADVWKNVAGVSTDTTAQMVRSIMMLYSTLNDESLADFNKRWQTSADFRGQFSGIVGDEFANSMTDGTMTLAKAQELLNKRINELDVSNLQEYGMVMSGTAEALKNYRENGTGTDWSSGILSAVANWGEQDNALKILKLGVGTNEQREQWAQTLGYSLAQATSLIADGTLDLALQKQRAQIDATMEYLAKSGEAGAKALWSGMNAELERMSKLYTNPLYSMMEAGINGNMSDSVTTKYLEGFVKKFENSSADTAKAFREFWDGMTSAERNAFVQAYGLEQNFVEKMARGMTDSQLSESFAKAWRTDVLNKAIIDQNLVMKELSGVYEAAVSGGQDYVSTMDDMTQAVYDYRAAYKAFGEYKANKNNMNARSTLQDYFGVNDITRESNDIIDAALDARRQQIANSMTNIIGVIQQLTGNSNLSIGDLMGLTVGDDQQLAYLAQMYLQMRQITTGAEDARIEMEALAKTIKDAQGTDEAKTRLVSSFIMDEKSFEYVKANWAELSGSIGQYVGEAFTRAMQEHADDLTQFTLEEAQKMLNANINFVNLQSLENNVNGAKKILSGLAEHYRALMSGDLSDVNISDDMLKDFDDYAARMNAYTKLQSGKGTELDRQGWMKDLGIGSLSELSAVGVELAYQRVQLENTINALSSMIGLTGEESLEQLQAARAALGDSNSELAIMYDWLIRMKQVGTQIDDNNPFMTFASTVMNDSEILIDERISYLKQLLAIMQAPLKVASKPNMDEYQVGNVDLYNRPQLQTADGYETVASELFTTKDWDFDLGDFQALLHFTPIIKDENGQWYHMDNLSDYIYDIIEEASKDGQISIEEILEIDAKGVVRDDGTMIGGKNAALKVEEWAQGMSMQQAIAQAEEWDQKLHEIQEAYYSPASFTGYEQFQAFISQLSDTGKLQQFATAMGLDAEKLKLFASDSRYAAQAMNYLSASITRVSKSKSVLRYFSDVESTLEELRKTAGTTQGALKALDAATSFYGKQEKFNKAMDEYRTALDKLADPDVGKIDTSDIDQLASVLGIPAQVLIDNWSKVPDWIQDYVDAANTAMNELRDQLFVNITGTSDVDFSNLLNGILAVDESAAEMAKLLAQTGMYTVETVTLHQEADVLQTNADGTTSVVRKNVDGNYQVLKPAGSNPFRTSAGTSKYTKGSNSKKNGSSRSKSSSSSGKTPEQIYVEKANWALERLKNTAQQLSTIMGTWQDEGYYTAMIGGYKKSNEILEEQNRLLMEDIKGAQAQLPALVSELSKLKPGTEEYDKVLERIDTIQDAIDDWSQQLEENNATIRKNKKSIEDMYKAIRQLEIDLENEVLKAIEDREQKQKDMLEARIKMEETIFDILKNKHEKVEQEILNAIDSQIDALNKEKELINEILSKRKEDADAQKELNELAAMQAKYNRISVDPTRAREAEQLWQEIMEKQDELAWANTESEVNAQERSIDQQIDSLQDYKEYIEAYYEQLLSSPKNFIDEINSILEMSQEDILAWLEQNSEEYLNSTDNTRLSMETAWSETLDTMNGVVRTHWDEVYEIIAKGEDYVIEFLKQNSSEYAAASKLQQEAYLEGWSEMFENIRKANAQLAADLRDTTYYTPTVTSGNKDNTGGGGSGGSGGANNNNNGSKYKYKTTLTVNAKDQYDKDRPYSTTREVKGGQASTQAEAKKLLDDAIKATLKSMRYPAGYAYTSHSTSGATAYKKGGYVDYTGPAWVDGTKGSPEYMLNASQTKMMESLIAALEMRVKVPTMPAFDSSMFAANNTNGYTFNGGITIQVDSLADDADYDEIAEKVKESIVDAMTRGKAIGY